MKIHYFALCWNEERILPHTLEYYSKFCDRITIFDNESTDRSVEIIKSYGGNVETYSSNNEIRDDIYLDIKNNCWKDSIGEADWVIVGDIDELLFHPNLIKKLSELKEEGYTIIKPHGFDMVTETFPKNLLDIRYGMPDNDHLGKCICFNPNAIEEINYKPGCHKLKPKGRVKYYKKSDMKLFHYKYLGLEYLFYKMELYKQRLSAVNLENKWGKHYLFDEDKHEADYLKRWNKAVKVY